MIIIRKIFILSLKYILNNITTNNGTANISKYSYLHKNINQNVNKEINLKKNLIITIVVRYSWEKILPFIKSVIRINNRNFDIVIFISEVSQQVKDNLKSLGIIIYEISTKMKSAYHIFRQRWKIFSDFLENNKIKYNIVLCLDIRDTIIQKEFFSLYENYSNFLGFSYESSTLERLIQKDYIINNFGEKIYKMIENERNINCGTIWGTINDFIFLSKTIYKNLLIHFSVDQTILNYLIYVENILKNRTIIFSDEYGPVLTLGLTKRNKIKLDSENNILNFNNKIASIVHQYDRNKDIKRIIKQKYCPELNYYKKIFILFVMDQILMLILIIKILVYFYFKKNYFKK